MSTDSDTITSDSEVVARKRWGLAAIALLGFSLILLAIVLPHSSMFELPRELVKELGIAVLAVFSVSYVYEIGLAQKHMEQFTARMRAEIMKGQGTASTCAVVGIDEIYRDRSTYEQQYGIFSQLRHTDGGMYVRLVARSAYTVVGHAAERLAEILERGAHVEICILDPRMTDHEFAWNVDVARPDVIVTLKSLRAMVTRQLVAGDAGTSTGGKLSLAVHRVPMLDSYLYVSAGSMQWCTWDLSFGRDTSRKMVLMLDPRKALGKNVASRYDHVWQRAEKIYVYANRKVEIDLLSSLIATADAVESGSGQSGAA